MNVIVQAVAIDDLITFFVSFSTYQFAFFNAVYKQMKSKCMIRRNDVIKRCINVLYRLSINENDENDASK